MENHRSRSTPNDAKVATLDEMEPDGARPGAEQPGTPPKVPPDAVRREGGQEGLGGVLA
jgi:hypothetical protein